MENNILGWFEIPVSDMGRAKEFYETVLQIEISLHDMDPLQMGWFPFATDKPGAPGSLVKHPDFYHSSDSHGVLIYLSCTDVKDCLDRVAGAGGKVLVEKKQISPEHGFMGLLVDTEGNRIALHSQT